MKTMLICLGLLGILALQIDAAWEGHRIRQVDSNSRSPIHELNQRRGLQGGKRGTGESVQTPLALSSSPAAVAQESTVPAPSNADTNENYLASDSEGQLTTTFLSEIHNTGHADNVVLNSFGIWSVTSLIYSLSGGKTEEELSKLLNTKRNILDFAKDYGSLYDSLHGIQSTQSSAPVQSINSMYVVKKKGEKLKDDVSKTVRTLYKAKEVPINTKNPEEASEKVNKLVNEATNNLIGKVCQPNDFKDQFSVLILSAAYFNGKWKFPFNESATAYDVFKDEKDRVIAQNIPMMRNKNVFKYAFSSELQSQIVELPYGDEKTSMVIFLPRRNHPIGAVLDKMRGKSLHELLPEMTDEDVDLSLPRFRSSFRAALNSIFLSLGAGTMLNQGAELPGLSGREFISRIAHQAIIDVNEVGTVAAAVTSAQVAYKTNVINFQVNRPFLYFINDMPTRAVLFAGIYKKPEKSRGH